jgi:thiamine biosynthesis protein ThiS
MIGVFKIEDDGGETRPRLKNNVNLMNFPRREVSTMSQGADVQILVNGEARTVAEGTTVQALLQDLKLDPRFLAVERNQELVPRVAHAECRLAEGDDVEIVTLVGGG